jgi:hypothetical protein
LCRRQPHNHILHRSARFRRIFSHCHPLAPGEDFRYVALTTEIQWRVSGFQDSASQNSQCSQLMCPRNDHSDGPHCTTCRIL